MSRLIALLASLILLLLAGGIAMLVERATDDGEQVGTAPDDGTPTTPALPDDGDDGGVAPGTPQEPGTEPAVPGQDEPAAPGPGAPGRPGDAAPGDAAPGDAADGTGQPDGRDTGAPGTQPETPPEPTPPRDDDGRDVAVRDPRDLAEPEPSGDLPSTGASFVLLGALLAAGALLTHTRR